LPGKSANNTRYFVREITRFTRLFGTIDKVIFGRVTTDKLMLEEPGATI
jgi:hypothetical protein